VVFIVDPTNHWMPPEVNGRDLVAANKACVAVCTQHPQMAETTFELSVSISRPLSNLVFEGKLDTPGLKIAIEGADGIPFLAMDVREAVTPIKIWTNDMRSPDHVQIQAEADFSNVVPYAPPRAGEEMDRPTAERLVQAAQKLDKVEAEFAEIATHIKKFSQRSRINLSVITAIHDIQEAVGAEVGSAFPDLRTAFDKN
jgi:hypothetical protein